MPILDPVLNFVEVQASTGFDSIATSVALATNDGARLPDPATDGAYNLICYNSTDYASPAKDPYVEIVRVTARTADTLSTIIRGQELTVPVAHNIAGKVYKMILSPTKKFRDDIEKALQYTDGMDRQAIINGNFDVWQRGSAETYLAASESPSFLADRWGPACYQNSNVSRQAVAGTGHPGNSSYVMRCAFKSGIAIRDDMAQDIESSNSIKFRGSKVTLSFLIRFSSATMNAGAFSYSIQVNTGAADPYKGTTGYTIIKAGTINDGSLNTNWARLTLTTDATIGLTVNNIRVEFAFNNLTNQANTYFYELSQVQLCAGDIALPFQPKSSSDELRACQRYYEIGNFRIRAVDNNYQLVQTFPFKVNKRIAAAVSVVGTGVSYGGNALIDAATVATNAVNGLVDVTGYWISEVEL